MGGGPYDFIHNLLAEQRMAFRERERQLGRIYLGRLSVSDVVLLPGGADAYIKAAEGVDDVTVQIDHTGELSRREAPPEGHAYAVVTGDSGVFWDRLNEIWSTEYEVDEGSDQQ